MSFDAALRSSVKDDWETPDALFEQLHAEFGFTLDVCATHMERAISCCRGHLPKGQGIRMFPFVLVLILGCTPMPSLRDSYEVRDALHCRCQGKVPFALCQCVPDPDSTSFTVGEIRDINKDLETCRKAQI